MKRLHYFLAVVVALVLAGGLGAVAQVAPHLTKPVPGGMPGFPLFTDIVHGRNSTLLTWDGPSGAYQLFQRGGFGDPSWHPVGKVVGKLGNVLATQTVTGTSNIHLFRLSGPSPLYAGAQSCVECHRSTVENVSHTRHFGAFTNALFVAKGGQSDPSCLACHTVGYGLTGGFRTNTTLRLANVQCESCHGTASDHAANPEDPATRPRVDLSAAVCGGCHQSDFVPARVKALHPPRYEEWNASPHRAVSDALKIRFASPSGTNAIANCGACHSGTVRETLIAGKPLPSAHEAGAVGIACGVCHDAHKQFVHTNLLHGLQTNLFTGTVITNNQLGAKYTNQMEAPLASLVDFHSSGNLATNDHAGINICAQCHNDRGASASSGNSPPHRSAQYNMLIGSFRTEDTGAVSNHPSTHALLEKQCVACHMQTSDGTSGHRFKADSYSLCAECHTSPELLVQFVQGAMTSQIERNKAALDFWALMKAPAALRSYGARAWEYTNPGTLSAGGLGPTATEQALIPDDIKKARFNLYQVYYEGSLGVHNGRYAADLLATGYNLVVSELNK